ncbi:hypothetical protein [Streptomyces sp. NPDC005167]
MTDTRTETAASLLHLVDRAERGSLLAEEAQQLRNGIRALAAPVGPGQYAVAVECAIGLNVDCDGAEGVYAVRDAVLAVRDQEMEQLRADLKRVQQAACRTAESLRKAERAVAALDEQQPTP